MEQWRSDFTRQWNGNLTRVLDLNYLKELASGKRPVFPSEKTAVWILPAHLLSLMSDEQVLALSECLKPDAVILDEIHVFKTREKSEESQRRTQTKKLLSLIAEENPKRMVLGLSGIGARKYQDGRDPENIPHMRDEIIAKSRQDAVSSQKINNGHLDKIAQT